MLEGSSLGSSMGVQGKPTCVDVKGPSVFPPELLINSMALAHHSFREDGQLNTEDLRSLGGWAKKKKKKEDRKSLGLIEGS